MSSNREKISDQTICQSQGDYFPDYVAGDDPGQEIQFSLQIVKVVIVMGTNPIVK